MRRAYLVVGKLEDNDMIDIYYGVCHSMSKADEMCLEAESEDPRHIYVWYPVIEEDD